MCIVVIYKIVITEESHFKEIVSLGGFHNLGQQWPHLQVYTPGPAYNQHKGVAHCSSYIKPHSVMSFGRALCSHGQCVFWFTSYLIQTTVTEVLTSNNQIPCSSACFCLVVYMLSSVFIFMYGLFTRTLLQKEILITMGRKI